MKAERVKKHYTDYAEAYEDAYGSILQACRAPVLEEMLDYIAYKSQLEKGLSVLDCGGGYGVPAAYFSQNYEVKVTSLNITECQLEKARADFPYVKHVNLSFDNLERLRGDYDRILFLESLGHTRDISGLFEKVYNRLKTGGLVFIKHPCAASKTNTVKELERFYDYIFFPLVSVIGSAVKAGFLLDEARVTPYGEYNKGLVDKFSSHVNGQRCFVHPYDYDFSLMRYYDFVFRKE